MLPDFTIRRPSTVAEACGTLAAHGDDAVAYAGGCELLLEMKRGATRPRVLVDLKGVPGLDGLTVDDGVLRIGALVTHRRLERSPEVAAVLPALIELERHLGNVRVRVTGTIGGNLGYGEPHSDPGTFLVAAGATVHCAGPGGDYEVPAADLLRGPFDTALGPHDLIVRVDVPVPPPGTTLAHRKFVLLERPAANVAVRLAVADGVVRDATVVAGAATPRRMLLPAAAQTLVGVAVDDGPDALRAAGTAAAETVAVVPEGDEAYLRQLVSVLTRRAAADALAAAV